MRIWAMNRYNTAYELISGLFKGEVKSWIFLIIIVIVGIYAYMTINKDNAKK